MPLPPNRVDYMPIIDRPVIRWPNDARVALWVTPNIEHYEYLPEYDDLRDPWPRTAHPDVQQYSYCDYGNRVGFWRMLDVLDKHKIRCTIVLNMGVLDHFPEIKQAMIERDWGYVSHGIYNTRYITGYTEDQERAFYRDTSESLKRHTGKTLKGMLGPALSNSDRTPDLMAEAGLLYHADWVHDDQPVPIKVRTGKLISIPYSLETNDGIALRAYSDGDYFARICKAQFDQLYKEGGQSGRVMCISLHPFIIGLPHHIGYLDHILGYIMSHEGVWQATGDEIAEYYMYNYYDQAVRHAENLNK